MSAKQFKYCFEDFRVGMVIEQPGPTLTRDDILEFARRYDPQPIHLDEVGLRRAASLRREIPELAYPRALARFLTGLPSPRLTRSKLRSHPLFGAFGQVPFAEVLRRVEG